ncbi:MAG: diguanylate cyclase, partial [Pseudomonadota bacterium]
MALETEKKLLKILVCDDDPADRKLARVYLQQIKGREIVMLEAGESSEIAGALEKGRIDLVLMDIQMPEKSGMEWLKDIVEKKIAPVVIMTGSGDEELAVQALQEGAMGYLPKGRISTERLESTIDEALKRWGSMQQSLADWDQLEQLAFFDPLTKILNRRAVLRKLEEQVNSVRRYGEGLSLVMLDIDHFKKVNDSCGHLTGDEVLAGVASLLRGSIRVTDFAGRYGGEEFIVVLTRTRLDGALVVAHRLRKIVDEARTRDCDGNDIQVTASLGLTEYRQGDDPR